MGDSGRPITASASAHASAIKRVRPARTREDQTTPALITLLIIFGWLFLVLLLAQIELRAEATLPVHRKTLWKRAINMRRWSRMRDAPFEISIASQPAVGVPFDITSHWHTGSISRSRERITVMETHQRMCWDFEGPLPALPVAIPDWVLGTDRCISFEEVNGGRHTRIKNVLTFSGPLGVATGLLMGSQIEEAFRRFNSGLKRRF